MNERYTLEAAPRHVIGKKVKRLRAAGHVPGVIYGKTQEPVHVAIEWPQLRTVLVEAGGSNLVDVQVGDDTYTTLIREVDRDYIRNQVLHVDFYAVNLKEKIINNVPIILLNQEDAVVRVGGRVVLEALTLTVSSLPTDIPSEIKVSLDSLEEIGDTILVRDLPSIEGVEFLDDPETPVVRTDYFREIVEEEEEEDISILEELGAEPELVGEDDEEEFPEDEDF